MIGLVVANPLQQAVGLKVEGDHMPNGHLLLLPLVGRGWQQLLSQLI